MKKTKEIDDISEQSPTETQEELSILKNLLKNPEQRILTEQEYKKYLTIPIRKLETPIFQQVMLRRINELRKKEKLPALKFDEKLTEVATAF